jgi:hypothetical protein
MSILFNFVFADTRVTAWSRRSHGQVQAWTLRTRQRWQHPLQPNDNWHRARHQELTSECVWKQGGTDKDRQDHKGRAQQTRKQTQSDSLSHSLLGEDLAARPPVQAALRLAALGLDGTRPTPREETGRREWQRTGTDSQSELRLADGKLLPNIQDF